MEGKHRDRALSNASPVHSMFYNQTVQATRTRNMKHDKYNTECVLWLFTLQFEFFEIISPHHFHRTYHDISNETYLGIYQRFHHFLYDHS